MVLPTPFLRYGHKQAVIKRVVFAHAGGAAYTTVHAMLKEGLKLAKLSTSRNLAYLTRLPRCRTCYLAASA